MYFQIKFVTQLRRQVIEKHSAMLAELVVQKFNKLPYTWHVIFLKGLIDLVHIFENIDMLIGWDKSE